MAAWPGRPAAQLAGRSRTGPGLLSPNRLVLLRPTASAIGRRLFEKKGSATTDNGPAESVHGVRRHCRLPVAVPFAGEETVTGIYPRFFLIAYFSRRSERFAESYDACGGLWRADVPAVFYVGAFRRAQLCSLFLPLPLSFFVFRGTRPTRLWGSLHTPLPFCFLGWACSPLFLPIGLMNRACKNAGSF